MAHGTVPIGPMSRSSKSLSRGSRSGTSVDDSADLEACADRLEPGRLRRAGEWRDRGPHLQDADRAAGAPLDVGERPKRPHTSLSARLRADTRGRDGRVRQELAAGVAMAKATTKLTAQDRIILFCVATGIDH